QSIRRRLSRPGFRLDRRQSGGDGDQLGLQSGSGVPLDLLALGDADARRLRGGHARFLRADAEIADRAWPPHRDVSFVLLQPKHTPGRPAAGAVLPGPVAAGDDPRRQVARPGIANPARTGAETGSRRRRLFRAIVLLSPLYGGLLYAPVRADAGE